ncbi:cell cycle protein [Paenibacillus sp. FSL R7-0273]|uniref:FtsW/RodA/SpoVE family cell cycle protein n=1 Tax=Paenibacillus sp. FSL R7-0273 TaxID=1536772 RepID=UPI0004F5F945|nr:FtsW/RodA/SpoVE family cell cycle protein [Paenibacillus sp. FSL R7-0273]AIQ49762.1 cell cycle protein [Paenibacillus sp. FSL R7-0273]OMF92344.1 cell cycle protein [Paenibacillus sp. FSL R7-0273]
MLQRIKKIDGVIVIVLLMLMAVSILAIYSVTHGRAEQGMHIQMIQYYAAGFFVFFGLSLFDYRLLVRYAVYIYIAGIGVLVMVSLFGTVKYGARAWLEIGNFSFQPAELFKLILILALAAVLVRLNRSQLRFWRDVMPLSMIALLPFGIVIVQNDMGNALSFVVILVGLLWIGRIKLSHALIGLAVAGGLLGGFVYSYINYHEQTTNFLSATVGREHFIKRFDPWLVPERASSDDSYQTRNARIAIGSGGLLGEGYLKGSSVQSNKIPVLYSDAIFAQIAEEFGFIGAAVLLLLFFILIHRMILFALECKDRAGPFLIIGIVAMLLYQILENIGAYIGLMPLTGITLPFISYGGTSVLINMASMGIAMSVHLYGQDVEEELPAVRALHF